jgi:hypothetical protein
VAERVPADLLRLIQADFRQVRPLPPPWRRALALAPFGALLVWAVPLFWGWRSNLTLLGFGVAWGLSGVQAVAGLFILAAALREAVPGRILSARALTATVGAALVLVAGVTLITAATAPNVVPPGRWLSYAWECFGEAVVSGLPLLAAVAWLAARAAPTRPALTGAIYGLGVGLVADAGVRLFCWVSEPAHVVIAHGAAIFALVAAGALTATLIDRLGERGDASVTA